MNQSCKARSYTILRLHPIALVATPAITFLLVPAGAWAQQDRITDPIDLTRTVVLKGSLHPKAESRFEQGRVEGLFNLPTVMILLKPSSEQQAALEDLLAEQQDPSSPNFHTKPNSRGSVRPRGQRYWTSPHLATVAKLQDRLCCHGAQLIMFQGSAAQVERAFHTEIHHYTIEGEQHFANSMDPSIPAALSDVVSGFRGLDDFQPRSRADAIRTVRTVLNDGSRTYVAPDVFATIYDLNGLYSSGITGAGQKIVVVGQADFDSANIAAFRTMFNLPKSTPQVVQVPNTPDPGLGVTTDDVSEEDLDLEWVGAVARNATIIYVYSNNTFTSAQYAIDQDLAPVVTMSYGDCESKYRSSDIAFFRTLAQQAVSQGITWLVASGDSFGWLPVTQKSPCGPGLRRRADWPSNSQPVFRK